MTKIKNFNTFNEGYSGEGGNQHYVPEVKYPMIYGIMTQELADRLRKKGPRNISVMDDGYIFLCETPKEFNDYKEKYAEGNMYKDELITKTVSGPAKNYGK